MTITWYGIPVQVEAGLSSATGSYATWDTSLWDTGTWGPDVIWTDISAWVQSFNTQRGFSRHLQAWEPGSATIVLDNTDGRFSPANLSGPYVIGGVTGIRPWRPIRIKIADIPIYTGYALAWNETYARGHATSTVTVPCKDEFASLARVDGFETSLQGPGELSSSRIHRILDSAGHQGERNIDEGRFTMQGTTLEDKPVSELTVTADSEGGAIWVDPGGAIRFQHRYGLAEAPKSATIQATFGDGTGGPFEILCSDIRTNYDGDLVSNIAAFARKEGEVQTVADQDSRALYGDSRHTRQDLMNELDSDVLSLATTHVATFKDADLRIEAVEIKPRTPNQPLTSLYLFIAEVRDRVRVILQPSGGYTITRDCFIQRIAHSMRGGDWTMTLELAAAVPWTSATSYRWDTGVWDSAVWFF